MLAPFHYYGVSDFTDARGGVPHDESALDELLSEQRIDYLLEMLRIYGYPRGVKGLMFCSRMQEARLLSAKLNRRFVNGHLLRTVALTGDDSEAVREAAVKALEEGKLDYILTVDIFNEGIDIPSVNQIVMLRGTQSSIIFTQQLGRGLRKAAGKDHLRVIDFIGNYANNYLIPVALTGDRSANKDSIREKMVRSTSKGLTLGTSSVNFDRISQERILESLSKAQLSGKKEFREAILNLRHRLGQLPRLIDFSRFDTIDPFILASRSNNYWTLLRSFKMVDLGPTKVEENYLKFLSLEILNGLRPHETLLLQALLTHRSLSRHEFRDLLEGAETTFSPEVISSTERVLTLQFFTSRRRDQYGGIRFLEVDGDQYRIDSTFEELYFAYKDDGDRDYTAQSFRAHVDDILDTSLALNRQYHSWRGDLVVGNLYGRRDVCRLLQWERNEESTMYGYRVDKATSTCPIFVTYNKDPEVAASVRYEDEFLSANLLKWYSKSDRTLDSKELKPIIRGQVPLHLFVKKSDSDGNSFYYLGLAESGTPQQTTMPGEDDREHDVVTMGLKLQSPVERGLYDYLTNDGVVAPELSGR